MDARFEELGVFSDLDLIFILSIDDFEEVGGSLSCGSNVGEEVRVVSNSHCTEYNGVDGCEDIFYGNVFIVSDKDCSKEEDECKNDKHDHLSDSIENSRNVTFFNAELQRFIEQLRVFVEYDILISKRHYSSDVYHGFSNEA